MQKIKFITAFISSAILLTSCEKVIDVDLNSTAKKYVIEGIITDQPNGSSIRITQTKDFDTDNQFPGVSGATVVVTDNGVPVQLTESTPGLYSNAGLQGVPGHTYKMEVSVGGQSFNATSTMPAKVNFDTMYVKEELFFGVNRQIPNLQYFDPAGKGNAYRFILYRNHKKEDPIYVVNDDYSENRLNSWQLLTYEEQEEHEKIRLGDTVTVDMLCIDKNIFKYWFSVGAASGDGSSATPANPVSNISGGALGYFSAHTYQRREVKVK